jgi:hypothetical protein
MVWCGRRRIAGEPAVRRGGAATHGAVPWRLRAAAKTEGGGPLDGGGVGGDVEGATQLLLPAKVLVVVASSSRILVAPRR